MAEMINCEREATHNGYSEKMLMVTISLQEYRSLIDENAVLRELVGKLEYDMEKERQEKNRWHEAYTNEVRKEKCVSVTAFNTATANIISPVTQRTTI